MDEKVTCELCDGNVRLDDALFDEQAELYFCDLGCFEEWADENFDEIVKQYRQLHLYHAG
ncbi:hypothetical protein [Oceanobacillus damuensis]|uniref:hypothetical protein n=1 Tax=Oceanobacillus damuensis TaxID=937928 RepID=UPI0008360927|nr:hypothetical protein [Oceanobacillus damuensis]